METATKEKIDELLMLPSEERAQIANELLKSLDEPDPDVTAAWMEECKRRVEAFDRGEMEACSEDEVFAKLDRICESES